MKNTPIPGGTSRWKALAVRAVRKTLWMLLVLWGITLVSFFVIHLAPGTPTDMQTSLNPLAGDMVRERLNAAAPRARAVEIFRSIFAAPERMFRYTETTVIHSTVQPERKLMLLTLMIPIASSTGLMMTPPPIPHIEPTIDDKILTAKKTIVINISISLPFQ